MSCRSVKKRGGFQPLSAEELLKHTTRPPKASRVKEPPSTFRTLRKWFDRIPSVSEEKGRIPSRQDRRQRWFGQVASARHQAPKGTRFRYHLALQPFCQAERKIVEVLEREPYGSLDPVYKGRRNTYKVKRGFLFIAEGNRQGMREQHWRARHILQSLRSIEKKARALHLVPLESRDRAWKQSLRFLKYQTRELRPTTANSDV